MPRARYVSSGLTNQGEDEMQFAHSQGAHRDKVVAEWKDTADRTWEEVECVGSHKENLKGCHRLKRQVVRK